MDCEGQGEVEREDVSRYRCTVSLSVREEHGRKRRTGEREDGVLKQ